MKITMFNKDEHVIMIKQATTGFTGFFRILSVSKKNNFYLRYISCMLSLNGQGEKWNMGRRLSMTSG